LLEEANGELKFLQKQFLTELESMRSTLRQDENRVHAHSEEVRELQENIIERDYKVETQLDKVKALEDEVKKFQLDFEQTEARLKLVQEELYAKDDLLNEKFQVKLPKDDGGFKLFGNSRVEVLEKELIKTKQATIAHQTHSAYLGMELNRLEREMKLQLKLREQTIDRLKKEVGLLRKRLFNLSKDKGERMQELPPTEVQKAEDDAQLEKLRKKYFLSLVIGVKMNLLNQGRTCNVNGEQLYEQAMAEGVTKFEEFGDFVDVKMTMQSELIPM